MLFIHIVSLCLCWNSWCLLLGSEQFLNQPQPEFLAPKSVIISTLAGWNFGFVLTNICSQGFSYIWVKFLLFAWIDWLLVILFYCIMSFRVLARTNHSVHTQKEVSNINKYKIKLLLCQNQLLYFKMKVILVRLYYSKKFD